jgi:hypothetical protein
MSGIPFAVKRALEARDKSKCRICGGLGTERMHRMRRREGGHSLSNLILGCHTCHVRAHANPERAYRRGWHVRANGIAVPAEVPLWTLGGWVKLDDDGGVAVIAPATTLDPEHPGNVY